MYDPKSLKAEEFICHEEIEDTLKYADENKDNMPLIREILDKARLCKGLSHREASVLLACEDPEILDEIYKLANEIKHKFYGNRIVMFAPLYLSNYCVNGCIYCPYHRQNHHIPRRKLTQEAVSYTHLSKGETFGRFPQKANCAVPPRAFIQTVNYCERA